MKTFYYLSFFLLACFISCSDDDMSTGEPSDGSGGVKELKIKSYYINDVLRRAYDYENDLLKTIFYYSSSGALGDILTMNYGEDTITREIRNSDNELRWIYKYYSLNDNSFRRDRYRGDTLYDYRVYDNYTHACGYDMAFRYDYEGNLLSTLDVEHTDENCSSILTDEYLSTGDVRTYLYERDDKNYYGSATITSYFKPDTPRNTIKYEYEYQGEIDLGTSYTATYEYNSDDYPTSETRQYYDGNTVKYSFEYY